MADNHAIAAIEAELERIDIKLSKAIDDIRELQSKTHGNWTRDELDRLEYRVTELERRS